MNIPIRPKFEFEDPNKPFHYYNETYRLWMAFSADDVEYRWYQMNDLQAVLPIIADEPSVIREHYSEIKKYRFDLLDHQMSSADGFLQKFGFEENNHSIICLGFTNVQGYGYLCVTQDALNERVSKMALFDQEGRFMNGLDVGDLMDKIENTVSYTP